MALSQEGRPQLRGKVCDAGNKPIASATVILKAQDQAEPLTAQTGADGTFSFQSVRSGSYRIQVSATGFIGVNRPVGPILPEKTIFELIVLKSDSANHATPSSSAPQFFDPPQFTISGVTDTTNLGGHGSGPITRNREAVEKDVASLAASSSISSSNSTSSAYQRALSYANAGEYARAHEELERLPAQQQTAAAHHLLGVVDEKLGDSLDAVHEYQRAAELEPGESNTFDWGSELLLHHAAEPAIEVFAKGNRSFPKSTRMLIGLGAAEFAAGSYDRAEKRLCQASDLDPRNPAPYEFLGKIQRTEKTISPEVVDRFRRFQELDPDNADANYLYAVALWKQNEAVPTDVILQQIESLLKTALRINPKFAEAYLQFGIVHSYQHDSAASIADFQSAVTNQPNLEEAHYRLAQAFRSAGKMEDAKAEIAKYERLRQQSAEQIEREHREIKQFVYSLRDKASAQVQ